MTTSLDPAIEGARLGLHDAVRRVFRSFHPSGADAGMEGDLWTGEQIASRAAAHVEKIRHAVAEWQRFRKYYADVGGKP